VSILHVELFQKCGDESLLAKTDAGTVFLAVDFNAEESACQAKIGDLVVFREPGLNFNRSFDSVFCVQH